MQFNINQRNIMSLYALLLDSRKRNRWFKEAITAHCHDKVVLDMGTGTGLLANYALEAGARFVYCVESEPTVARLADDILSQCHDRSRFKVITCDFNSSNIDQHLPANGLDVFISETISWSLFDQGLLNSWKTAKRFMKPDGISIPDGITADAWITDPLRLEHYSHAPQGVSDVNLLSDPYFLACEKVSQSDDYGYCIMVPARHLSSPNEVLSGVITARYGMDTPMLCFNAEAKDPCQISIMGQIHAPGVQSLPITQCYTTGWHMVPSMYLPSAGTYEISYRYNHFNANNWLAHRMR